MDEEQKIVLERSQEEEEDVQDISSEPGLEELHLNPPKRRKAATVQQQQHKKAKAVKPKKSTPKKDAEKRVIKLLDEDIKKIVEGLKSLIEE